MTAYCMHTCLLFRQWRDVVILMWPLSRAGYVTPGSACCSHCSLIRNLFVSALFTQPTACSLLTVLNDFPFVLFYICCYSIVVVCVVFISSRHHNLFLTDYSAYIFHVGRVLVKPEDFCNTHSRIS